MATKKSAPTDDELLAQLDSLSKPKSSKASSRVNRQVPSQNEQDLLAELGNLAQRPASRPQTPSLRTNITSRVEKSPMRSAATPPPGRMSEEKYSNNSTTQRKSGDSQRSAHQAFTPATTTTDESPEPEVTPAPSAVPAKSGGGWWGGFLSTATAAVTQAQNAVKDIQKNEEAQKWTDQLRGNVGMLRGFGGDLRSMAIPTFQNILETLAPPISAHEKLAIHITHDLKNYPSLDPTIHQVFSRVMAQVEGGDLMVIQRGAESGPKRQSREGNRPITTSSWQDGPWWRQSGDKREINAVRGLVEGTKLARASAEGYATDYFSTKGGVEQAAKRATETLSESNPTRESEIFLAIQAVLYDADKTLFQSNSTSAATTTNDQVKEPEDTPEEEILFAIHLHDPIHGIAFHAISQSIPKQWIDWLDATSDTPDIEGSLPESIHEIIESGGVDPREWVSEWVEELLSLAVGVVAQRYVARRMGVGEGGVGRGKAKLKADRSTESTIEGGGGEAARAMGGM